MVRLDYLFENTSCKQQNRQVMLALPIWVNSPVDWLIWQILFCLLA
jgi:hypothetical protein